MVFRSQRLRLAASLIFSALVFLCKSVRADTTYSGRSAALHVSTAPTGPLVFSDTGLLPSTGGARSASLLTATVPDVAQAGVLVACSSGGSGRADGSASLADLSLLPGTAVALKAHFVRAWSHADCLHSAGGAEIVGLQFGGHEIIVTGEPNQKVTIDGLATLIINEQGHTDSGGHHVMEVNALHLTVPGVAEVVVSHAASGIDCVGSHIGPCADFVTGGGHIAVSGGQAAFGLAGGLMGSETTPSVNLIYVDGAAHTSVEATTIGSYTALSRTSRRLSGQCKVNGQEGFLYVVEFVDGGDGALDTFAIHLSNGYAASGHLLDGDIALHAEIDLTGVTFSSSHVCGGHDLTGHVVLHCRALGGATIQLVSSNPVVATVPSSVEILPGKSSAAFTIHTTAVDQDTPVTITATHGDDSVSAELKVMTQQLLSLKLSRTSVCDGMSVTGKVVLSCPADHGGVTVNLHSSNSEVASVPNFVVVPEGLTSATFEIKTVKVTSAVAVKITASYKDKTLTQTLNVKPQGIAGLSLSIKTACGGLEVIGKVTLNCAAGPGGITVDLGCTNPTIALLPDTVFVAEGQLSATFVIHTVPVAATVNVGISATLGASTKSVTLTVRAPALISLDLAHLEITGGLTVTGRVTLDCPAPHGGLTIHLASSNHLVALVPDICTVLEGKTVAEFSITTLPVALLTTVQISATLNGVVKTETLSVLP